MELLLWIFTPADIQTQDPPRNRQAQLQLTVAIQAPWQKNVSFRPDEDKPLRVNKDSFQFAEMTECRRKVSEDGQGKETASQEAVPPHHHFPISQLISGYFIWRRRDRHSPLRCFLLCCLSVTYVCRPFHNIVHKSSVSNPGSEYGFSDPLGQKWPTKIENKLRNFMFWSAGCSLLRAESFSCSLDVLYGG